MKNNAELYNHLLVLETNAKHEHSEHEHAIEARAKEVHEELWKIVRKHSGSLSSNELLALVVAKLEFTIFDLMTEMRNLEKRIGDK